MPAKAEQAQKPTVEKYNLLVLADHSNHSIENSVYPLVREMLKDPRCRGIDVASRGNEVNRLFFEKMAIKTLYASKANHTFEYSPDGRSFKKDLEKTGIRNYDAVLLRLPHPIADGFWEFLEAEHPHTLFINSPRGIAITGTKAFMLNFPDLCAPSRHCTSLEEIEAFRQESQMVLKPVRSYAGQGIVRVLGDKVSLSEGDEITWKAFCKSLNGKKIDYLAVKFLENVGQGDKRIVVCKHEILGASLRMPLPGGWVCNVARGGRAVKAEVDEHEVEIIEKLDKELARHGIVFYGIDTLMGDDGKRVLSEINTLSIGGLPKIAEYSGKPAVTRAATLLLDHVENTLGG